MYHAAVTGCHMSRIEYATHSHASLRECLAVTKAPFEVQGLQQLLSSESLLRSIAVKRSTSLCWARWQHLQAGRPLLSRLQPSLTLRKRPTRWMTVHTKLLSLLRYHLAALDMPTICQDIVLNFYEHIHSVWEAEMLLAQESGLSVSRLSHYCWSGFSHHIYNCRLF